VLWNDWHFVFQRVSERNVPHVMQQGSQAQHSNEPLSFFTQEKITLMLNPFSNLRSDVHYTQNVLETRMFCRRVNKMGEA